MDGTQDDFVWQSDDNWEAMNRDHEWDLYDINENMSNDILKIIFDCNSNF